MTGNMLNIIKFIILMTTLVFAVIAIMYVLELFTDEALKTFVEKLLKIAGIVTVTSVVVILLSSNSNNK